MVIKVDLKENRENFFSSHLKKMLGAPPHIYLLFFVINLFAINTAYILCLNKDFPIVGHDYRALVPQMLDTAIHYRLNGLTIQWYSPSFGGGLPAFPNPNNSQFSILEILPIWIHPWLSVNISSIFYISIGFIACFFLLRRVLKFHRTSSLLGAIFFSLNGQMMQILGAGHMNHLPLPLLPVFLLILLDASVHPGISGLLLGLCAAILLHQAAYLPIIIFCIAILITLPLIHLLKPGTFSLRRIFSVSVLGGLVTLLISASKIAAVYSYMRFFPRPVLDNVTDQPISGLIGILLQLLGTMTLRPVLALAGLDPSAMISMMRAATGNHLFGYWEFDMSVSPVVFGILVIGAYFLLRNYHRFAGKLRLQKRWLAVLLFLGFTWLGIEFSLVKGYILPILKDLPVLSSLHLSIRSTSAFIFPLCLTAAYFHNRFTNGLKGRHALQIFILINILTLVPLAAFFDDKYNLQGRYYDILPSIRIHEKILDGKIPDVTAIDAKADETQAIEQGVSNLALYEPLFGYNLEYYHPEIKPGPIMSFSDGYLNMTDPTGLIFPEVNGTRIFERIKVGDVGNLVLFVKHRQPAWKIPTYQMILDQVSLWAFIICLGAIAAYISRNLYKSYKNTAD